MTSKDKRFLVTVFLILLVIIVGYNGALEGRALAYDCAPSSYNYDNTNIKFEGVVMAEVVKVVGIQGQNELVITLHYDRATNNKAYNVNSVKSFRDIIKYHLLPVFKYALYDDNGKIISTWLR